MRPPYIDEVTAYQRQVSGHANPFTLAIAPTARGIGYVLFENETMPLIWGVREVRTDKTPGGAQKALDLIATHRPQAVVLEAVNAEHSRRTPRIRRLVAKIETGARAAGCAVHVYPRDTVRRRFFGWGSGTKDDMAGAVAAFLPALAHRLPPQRRAWESEHYAMGIFEAAALGLTHFAEQKREAA